MACRVPVMTMARVPPKQSSEMAIVRNRIIRKSYIGTFTSPKRLKCVGRFSICMKNRAATAGMIMFASISASERSAAPKTRILRL